MPSVFHTETLALEPRPSPVPEFRWHTSPDLAHLAGAENLRLNLRSLDPSRYSYPYHFHHNAEEAFIILEGALTLRTPEGFQVLAAGDIAIFEKGPASAHQVYNHTSEPCRYIDIVAAAGGDVVQYPDTGKVMIGALRLILDGSQQRGYYDDEERVADHWPAPAGGFVT